MQNSKVKSEKINLFRFFFNRNSDTLKIEGTVFYFLLLNFELFVIGVFHINLHNTPHLVIFQSHFDATGMIGS